MSIAHDQQQVSNYLAAGFKPVRLRKDTKKPIHKEWQLHDVPESELHEWLDKGGAMGLQMGEVSRWLACVDLDWPEARWLAPKFLPENTLKGAKGNEEPTQFFYIVPNLPYAKFNGLKRGKSAEILSVKASERGKGHQVAVAPTIHDEKGRYRWVPRFDPSLLVELDPAYVEHQVRLLASASLIARELPPSREEGGGGRHDLALALSGFLLRGGVSAADVQDILVGAWEYRGADLEAIADVEAAVRDTRTNLERGELVTSAPTVDEVVPRLSGKLAKFLNLGSSPPHEKSTSTTYLKPPIEVNDVPLQDAGDEALAALLVHNDPPRLFTRGGTPIRLMHDPREDEPIIQEITVDLMRFEIAQAADFVKSTKNTSKYVFPPRDIVTYVRSHTGTANLPAFVGITRCPVVRPDGSLLLEGGFDEATGLWFAPQQGLVIPRVSDVPSEEEVKEAMEVAWKQLADFPFVDRASGANILAFPLTLILRPAIEGHVPLLVIDKPSVGTGASLMVDMLATAILGKSAGAVGAPADDDAEMRKLITGALRHSRQIVFFDNVATELKHASLARALTINFWEDRLLGHSLVVRLPQRAAWCATGNNIQMSSEIARRSYKVRLDAKQDRPWEGREFNIPDLNRWTEQHRGRLLWAYLTLARNYFAKGMPKPSVKQIGMFEPWSEVIGGVLEAAGLHGFLENRDELYESTTDIGGDWYAFLSAWRARYGDISKTTKAVVADLNRTSDQGVDNLRAALPDEFGSIDPTRPDTKLSSRLGNAFSAREGRRFGAEGLHLVRDGKVQGALRWKVATPDSTPEEESQIHLEGLLDD